MIPEEQLIIATALHGALDNLISKKRRNIRKKLRSNRKRLNKIAKASRKKNRK